MKKSTKKMFTHRVEQEQHDTLKTIANRLNKTKTHKFPIATFEQLQEIELIEFNTGELFTGFSKAEASEFIKLHTL